MGGSYVRTLLQGMNSFVTWCPSVQCTNRHCVLSLLCVHTTRMQCQVSALGRDECTPKAVCKSVATVARIYVATVARIHVATVARIRVATVALDTVK